LILVTGSLWIKRGYRSIGVVIHELALEAKSEAILTLYTPGSTPEPAEDLLKILLEKAITVRVIVNGWNFQPEHFKGVLLRFKEKHPKRLKIYNFKNYRGSVLHAKVFVIDGRKAIIGSSNLSWSGMYNNFEMAVLLEGKDAERVRQLLYALIRSSLCQEITG